MASPILIFDGVCNFCNGSVNFLLRHDTQGVFRFAANQSETGKELLTAQGIDAERVESVYVYADGRLLQKSDAALYIASRLPYPWRLLAVLRIVPAVLRDWLYDFVARNRYKWFGKRESCRLPTAAERERFV